MLFVPHSPVPYCLGNSCSHCTGFGTRSTCPSLIVLAVLAASQVANASDSKAGGSR